MSYIDNMPIIGKDRKKSFTETVDTGRNNSRARKALYNMIAFNEALEESMQAMLAEKSRGMPMDTELFAKMVSVKEKYLAALNGLERYDDKEEHLALVIYADAVQDVIKHLNENKRH